MLPYASDKNVLAPRFLVNLDMTAIESSIVDSARNTASFFVESLFLTYMQTCSLLVQTTYSQQIRNCTNHFKVQDLNNCLHTSHHETLLISIIRQLTSSRRLCVSSL